MKFTLKFLAFAVIVATSKFSAVAYAQTPKISVTPKAQTTSDSAKAIIQTKTPEDWIVYDDTTYTPVLDEVSRHLDAARKAFDAKDNKKASMELRTVADELKKQSARASKQGKAQIEADKELLVADKKYAQDTTKHLDSVALTVGSAAAAIDSGKINSKSDLDKVMGKAARADLERRWLVSDVAEWYPVTEEPQHLFLEAVAANARKDQKAAATDIRKAAGYLRLEAERAAGKAKQALENSFIELDGLANSVEKGSIKDEKSMEKVFANAERALALEHRAKASESFASKEFDKVGYELKASAHGLESAAGWVDEKAKSGVSATVADTRALGDKLASGGKWTSDEVAKGLDLLGNSIDTLGHKIENGK